jgi:cytochrome c553
MRWLFALGIFALLAWQAAAQDRAEGHYRRYCARCHDPERAGQNPDIQMLRQMTAEAVLAAMESGGTMETIARPMTDEQRRALAEYVSGKELKKPDTAESQSDDDREP